MGAGGLLAEVDRPDPRGAQGGRRVETVGALILAAGTSSRMGRNKLVEPLGRDTVIGTTIAAAHDAALPVLVVTGHDAGRTRAALPANVLTVHAQDHADGMGASLAAGIRAVPPDWDAAIVMLGDMPLVEARLLRALAGAARDSGSICLPVHSGKRGNPLLWGRDHFAALAGLAGDVGGKAVLAERQEHIIEVDAPSDAIFMDGDTPDALDAIRQAYEARAPG
ncbi:nucleotidyltransferase family protein [Pacificimonas sp. WHA3]|uniref:Nucleotidyltransferase family protein n=2 Tax=Pacificimonas pallii TaxID=2827236 RepID=A0ABS6SGJ3_9SPHN|nr:nucleotidyltransferase family protein [Pacificimonas pallii]